MGGFIPIFTIEHVLLPVLIYVSDRDPFGSKLGIEDLLGPRDACRIRRHRWKAERKNSGTKDDRKKSAH